MIIAKTENGTLKGIYFRDEDGKEHALKVCIESEMTSSYYVTYIDCRLYVDEIE